MSNSWTIQLQFPKFLAPAFYNDDKYSVIAAGRQSGKTMNAVIWVTTSLLAKPGLTGLWVDTKNGNIDKYVSRYFRKILGDTWKLCHYDKIHKILTFPNGSYLDFGSAEKPENMEGFSYDYMVVNEAGICLKKPELWQNTLQPMTRRAKVKFIGTPKGKNLFHTLYMFGQTQKQGFGSYHFSGYDSPFWTEEELNNIKGNVPEMVFKQEYLAQFLDNNAGVFRKIQTCLKDIKPLDKGEPGRQYAMGVDLAKTHDFTVVIVVDIQTKEVVFFDRFNKIDWPFQKERIYSIHKAFNFASVMLDSTGVGSAIFDDLKRALGSKLNGYTITSATKKELIEALVLAIETQSIYYFDIPELLNELEIYEYNVSRAGVVTYSAPEGFNDDCVIALALAWQLLKEPSNNFAFVTG